MPHNFSMLDTQFPHFEGDESTDAKIESVQDYLFMLLENLNYTLFNLGQDNFNAAELDTIKEWTISGISNTVKDIEGNISSIIQTTDSIELRVQNAEGNISSLTQTATSLTSRISTAEGDISTVTQTADKINWVVASGTSASNFTLTDRAINLVADTIDLSGFVTFSSLSASGGTTINGDNITTGTIDASRINTTNLSLLSLKNMEGQTFVHCASDAIYMGSIGYNTVLYVTITASDIIRIDGSGTYDRLKVDWDNSSFTPVYNDRMALGLNGARWSDVYTVDLNVSGVLSIPSLGTSGYYIASAYITTINVETVNISGSIIPGGYNTTLGNSSNYWRYAYLGSVETRIGSGSSSTIGFFGASPRSRITVSTSATLSDVITALKNYGLFG